MVTIGIDAEPNQPVPAGVLEMVASPAEQSELADLTAQIPQVCWDRLLFSAKESVFKAWFPLARRFLGFDEATVTFNPAGTFTARLLVPGPVVDGARIDRFTGRWRADDGVALTAITVPR
jgi:4'-phosphopantetheinyl transferase EntD